MAEKTGSDFMKLVLPFPPSVNTYWRAPNKGPLKAAISSVRKAGHIRARHAQRLLSSCVAFLNHHRHQLRWRSFFHQMRRRDIDNYNKALFDALTHAGIWEDDSQVKRMLVEWAPQVPGGKVEITIASYVENGRQNSNALVRA
jgi:crossover junction endodeoxyribonuclease RusA